MRHLCCALALFFISCAAVSLFGQEPQEPQEYAATLEAKDQCDCSEKGGHWYLGKCWANFSVDGISVDDIDRIVKEQMAAIERVSVKLDDQVMAVDFSIVEFEESQADLIVSFDGGQKHLVLSCPVEKLEGGTPFQADAVYLQGDILSSDSSDGLETMAEGRLDVQVSEDFDADISGTLLDTEGESHDVTVALNEAIFGAGSSVLEIRDGQAYLSGLLGTRTYSQIQNLITNHPEIKLITFTEIDGSINDAINMHTGRILREAGMSTRVLPQSTIASGGVDLFCAGVTRTVAVGARIGVHSWAGDGVTGDELPKDHPDHQFQLKYFRQVLGDDLGPKFYFFTLESAPAEGVHWMSEDEIRRWEVATDWSDESNGGTNESEITSTRIQPVTRDFPKKYRDAFDRYVQVVAPNGKPINIFAEEEISDAQLRHVRDVMLHYLTNFPDSQFGKDKGKIANRMADHGAMMMILKGSDGQFREPRIDAQPLFETETIVEGSEGYINNNFEDHRDATLEEVLHCVHDNGIGVDVPGAPKGVLADYQAEVRDATTEAMNQGLWPTQSAAEETSDWIEELRDEGSLTQEYLASVVDSYYGLWGPFDEDAGMWGIYIARTREDVRVKDPKGFAVIEKFFSPFLMYEAEIDPTFNGTFSLEFDPGQPYTHKSRYLLNARLTGNHNSNLKGNSQDNRLAGNSGDNVIDGGDGHDTVVFPRAESAYQVTKNRDGTLSIAGDGNDTLVGIEQVVFGGNQLDEQRFVPPAPTGLAR